MPNQNERPSMEMTLEERYNTQKVGGAFDAKSIKTSQGERMPIFAADGVSAAITETQWTKPNFPVKTPLMQTEFKDAEDGNTSKQLSVYLKGFTDKKYKP